MDKQVSKNFFPPKTNGRKTVGERMKTNGLRNEKKEAMIEYNDDTGGLKVYLSSFKGWAYVQKSDN